jgi:hypothetical protein
MTYSAWPRILFVFVTVIVTTRDIIAGGIILSIYLSTAVFGKVLIRQVSGATSASLRREMRRFSVFSNLLRKIQTSTDRIGRKRGLLRKALAGKIPGRIRELLVHEEQWTHYMVYAYLRCDPLELRLILEKYPFVRWQWELDYFKFSAAPFPKLEKLPARENIVVFERIDLTHRAESCRIFTDADFSFAYVTYGSD